MAPPRLRKTRNTLYLQPRDVEMLQSVETARYLTIPTLEWLHFPQWRVRYERHIAEIGTAWTYKPDSNLYHRLKLLAEGGMLHRIDLASSRVNPYATTPASHRTVYALARKGAEMIAEHTGRDDVWHDRVRTRSLQSMEHGLLIGQCYAALRSRVEASERGLQLHDWQGDHLFARNPLSIHVTRRRFVGDLLTTSEKVRLQPDAACFIQSERGRRLCLVEIDRGRHVSTWAEKMAAYAALVGSEVLRERFGVDSFLLLVATTTPQQLTRMADATVEELMHAPDYVRLCLHMALHPLHIGPEWQRIVGLQPSVTRVSMDGQREQSYSAELAPAVLIQ